MSCRTSARTRERRSSPAWTRTGVVRIRLELTDHGRQAHAGAVQEALEQAVADAAPDASGVTFDLVAAAAELPLLQITRRPAAAR